jgi:hypothetical protein
MRKQRWLAVIGFCICVAAFAEAALAQTPSVAIIAAPLANCPFCPPPPLPFGIFSAGATAFTPAANATNGNGTAGPTNIRAFAVAMLNPLVPVGLCPQ